jgi:hypothetical protein
MLIVAFGFIRIQIKGFQPDMHKPRGLGAPGLF